jgi:hypothetical protein
VAVLGERGHEADSEIGVCPATDFERDPVDVVFAALTIDDTTNGVLSPASRLSPRSAASSPWKRLMSAPESMRPK